MRPVVFVAWASRPWVRRLSGWPPRMLGRDAQATFLLAAFGYCPDNLRGIARLGPSAADGVVRKSTVSRSPG